MFYPGDVPTPPELPVSDRILIALNQLRLARAEGDVSREWAWTSMLDRLLDRYAEGMR